jgi:hypothetical protein
VFLVFAPLPLAWFVGAVASGSINPARGVAGGIAGVVAAWFIAGIPTYYWRRQIMLEEERIKTLAAGHTNCTTQALGLNNGDGQDVGLPPTDTLITSTQSGQRLLSTS